jgi:hypothetical protein
MSENRYCGNCKHFKDEDAVGWGRCVGHMTELGVHCSLTGCPEHKFVKKCVNGWTEITPDNVEELYDKPIAVAWKYEGKTYYSLAGDCTISLSTMAKHGGYYYYVLPELKIE